MEEEGGAGAPQEDLSRSPSVTDSRAMDGEGEFEQGTGGTGIALKLACIILARALTIIIGPNICRSCAS